MTEVDDASVAFTTLDIRKDLIGDEKTLDGILSSITGPSSTAKFGVASADVRGLSTDSRQIYEVMRRLLQNPSQIQKFKEKMFPKTGGAAPKRDVQHGVPGFASVPVGVSHGGKAPGIPPLMQGPPLIQPTQPTQPAAVAAPTQPVAVAAPIQPAAQPAGAQPAGARNPWLRAAPRVETPYSAPQTSRPPDVRANPYGGAAPMGAYGSALAGGALAGGALAGGVSMGQAGGYGSAPASAYGGAMGAYGSALAGGALAGGALAGAYPRLPGTESGRFKYLGTIDPNIASAPDKQYDLGHFVRRVDNSQQFDYEVRQGLHAYASAMPAADIYAITGGRPLPPFGGQAVIPPPPAPGVADMYQLANIGLIKEGYINEINEWCGMIGEDPPTGLDKLNFNQLSALNKQYKARMEATCTRDVVDSLVVAVGNGLASLFDGKRDFPVIGAVNLNSPRNLGARFSQMRDKPTWKYGIRQATQGSSIGANYWNLLLMTVMFEIGNVAFENSKGEKADDKGTRRDDMVHRVQQEKW